MSATADTAAIALSSITPGIAERLKIRKLLLAEISQTGIIALLEGGILDNMIGFTHPPIDEIYPELADGTPGDRERREMKRREHTIAAAKGAAQYRQVLEKKQSLAESLVVRVLDSHNMSKLRQMRVATQMYAPVTVCANGQTINGVALTDRHDGIAMLKTLLADLNKPADTKDVQAHTHLLHLMRSNPLPTNCTEERSMSRGVRRPRRSTTSFCPPARGWMGWRFCDSSWSRCRWR